MRSDSEDDANATNISAPMVRPGIIYTFPTTDANEYLTVDSHDKLFRTSSYWSFQAREMQQYKRLVPRMSQLQKQLLAEQVGDAVQLVDAVQVDYWDFDGGITMYPYHENVQPHYDYFASTIKMKGDLESIR